MSKMLEFLQIKYDNNNRMEAHKYALSIKPILRDIFTEFHDLYDQLAKRFFVDVSGIDVELGAGVFPVKMSYKNVLASDVILAQHLDAVFNAERIPFVDCMTRSIFCQNSFHHFANPDCFFDEAIRILKPGGGIVLIEPFYGFFASILYKNLFDSEIFDKNGSWKTEISNHMHGANQALSYIVFFRDRKLFEEKYPELELVFSRPIGNFLRYIFSGGLNFRQIIPNPLIPLLRVIEWILSPLHNLFALHYVIVVRKKVGFQPCT